MCQISIEIQCKFIYMFIEMAFKVDLFHPCFLWCCLLFLGHVITNVLEVIEPCLFVNMQESIVNKFNFGGGTHFGWKMCQSDRCSNLTVFLVLSREINANNCAAVEDEGCGDIFGYRSKIFLFSHKTMNRPINGEKYGQRQTKTSAELGWWEYGP